jgi:Uma2 family endonuclease
MSDAAHLVTAEEFEKLPGYDHRYELVEGRIILMSQVSFAHGRTVARLCALLHGYLRGGNLGVVVTEVGFTLKSNPDTVRAPDVAFIRQERLPATDPRGFWKGPPDLAIEVLSPDDRPGEIRAKVDEYLSHGVALVVVLDPDETTATLFRPSTPPLALGADEMLDLSDVVAGFRCTVREIFE